MFPPLVASVAQLVEQLTLNQLVVGSIPTRPTIPSRGAKVAELVDALDLGSSGVTRESSSLSFRTTLLGIKLKLRL